ncbi:MAG: phosphoribosylanthranilate isomerase [Rhodocyclaceae bacterium]|nr:phosphoribosylanthranilate isomerase [Rhodocyclaceae bacterium]
MRVSRRSSGTRIKICGIRDVETAQFAVDAGADAIGLVFFPPSPRAVDVRLARQIVRALPHGTVSVALFVNPTVAQVREVLVEVSPSVLQFHGDESAAFCAQFGHPYWKAIRVSAATDLLELRERFRGADRLLLDADARSNHAATDAGAKLYGGTGELFDWKLIPSILANSIVLACGLTADNVSKAIRTVRPWAVDVSSGVEEPRGMKSRALIQNFINAVTKEDSREQAV